ncbi:hypothetical protein X975_15172, partial [Stegodyphus mimosarum]
MKLIGKYVLTGVTTCLKRAPDKTLPVLGFFAHGVYHIWYISSAAPGMNHRCRHFVYRLKYNTCLLYCKDFELKFLIFCTYVYLLTAICELKIKYS